MPCGRVLTPARHQPRRYPTGLGEPTNRFRLSKYAHLQHFPAVNERSRTSRVAFERRRTWVRIPSAPLLNFLQTTKKLNILVVTQRARCSNRAATRVNLLNCWKN